MTTALGLVGFGQPSPQSRSHIRWFPTLCIPEEALGRQAICNICRCEVSCHLLTTDSFYSLQGGFVLFNQSIKMKLVPTYC